MHTGLKTEVPYAFAIHGPLGYIVRLVEENTRPPHICSFPEPLVSFSSEEDIDPLRDLSLLHSEPLVPAHTLIIPDKPSPFAVSVPGLTDETVNNVLQTFRKFHPLFPYNLSHEVSTIGAFMSCTNHRFPCFLQARTSPSSSDESPFHMVNVPSLQMQTSIQAHHISNLTTHQSVQHMLHNSLAPRQFNSFSTQVHRYDSAPALMLAAMTSDNSRQQASYRMDIYQPIVRVSYRHQSNKKVFQNIHELVIVPPLFSSPFTSFPKPSRLMAHSLSAPPIHASYLLMHRPLVTLSLIRARGFKPDLRVCTYSTSPPLLIKPGRAASLRVASNRLFLFHNSAVDAHDARAVSFHIFPCPQISPSYLYALNFLSAPETAHSTNNLLHKLRSHPGLIDRHRTVHLRLPLVINPDTFINPAPALREDCVFLFVVKINNLLQDLLYFLPLLFSRLLHFCNSVLHRSILSDDGSSTNQHPQPSGSSSNLTFRLSLSSAVLLTLESNTAASFLSFTPHFQLTTASLMSKSVLAHQERSGARFLRKPSRKPTLQSSNNNIAQNIHNYEFCTPSKDSSCTIVQNYSTDMAINANYYKHETPTNLPSPTAVLDLSLEYLSSSLRVHILSYELSFFWQSNTRLATVFKYSTVPRTLRCNELNSDVAAFFSPKQLTVIVLATFDLPPVPTVQVATATGYYRARRVLSAVTSTAVCYGLRLPSFPFLHETLRIYYQVYI